MGAALHLDLTEMRPALMRFAVLQVRDRAIAEDLVQETLVAVLEKPAAFAGRSALRTYVIGILKHKIIDSIRHAGRMQQFDLAEGRTEDDLIDSLFTANGHTVSPTRPWGNPDASLQEKDFFRVMEICLANLPEKTARLFMMREWLELDTPEICRTLGISTSNCWVMLYRARIGLRECLDLHWFGHRESAVSTGKTA